MCQCQVCSLVNIARWPPELDHREMNEVPDESLSAAQQLNEVELRTAEVLDDVKRVMTTLTKSYRSVCAPIAAARGARERSRRRALPFPPRARATRAQMTGLTVEYMGVYSGAIEHVTEELAGTIDASKDFMRKCLELDVEMEAIDAIAAQARFLDDDLDRLEAVVERLCADGSPRRSPGAHDLEPAVTRVSPAGSLRAAESGARTPDSVRGHT